MRSNWPRQVIEERVETDKNEPVVEHKPLDRHLINTFSLHNPHLLRKALPRHLTEPIPLIQLAERTKEHAKMAQTARKKKDEHKMRQKAEKEAKKQKQPTADLDDDDAEDEAEYSEGEDRVTRRQRSGQSGQVEQDSDIDMEPEEEGREGQWSRRLRRRC
jgi:glycerophosphoryl diester phosphodiesterase